MPSRWFFLCFSLICSGCNTVPPEQLQTFQDAQSAFDAEDYPLSVALYQRMLDEGVRSGAVYFNLGNAYARAHEPVRAVASYYLAKRYIPGDTHLNANMRTVLLEHGGTLPPSDDSIIDSFFFWQASVSSLTKIWVSLALTALTFFGGLFCLFRYSFRQSFLQSPWLPRSTVVSAILAAIALASAGYDWYRFDKVERVIVMMHALPRKGNSEQYEQAFVSPVPFGTLAVIQDERNEWYSLRFPGGQEGWLPASQAFRIYPGLK